MGRIKSALEIALERTESVASDKAGIEQFEAKQRGKRIANAFLSGASNNGASTNIEDELKAAPAGQRESLKQGVFDVLISQISLPTVKDDMPRIEAAGKGLNAVIGNNRFQAVHRQLMQVLSQYLDDAAQYDKAIQQQYAPKLRQKEEELSRRMGREVRLDPFQDPEFAAFYSQNINALKASYQTAVDQVREEAEQLFINIR